MMKRSFLAIGLALGLGFLVSCAVQQGPLSPSTTLIGQGNSSNMEMPLVSATAPASVTDDMRVTFQVSTSSNTEMDASTINTTNIKVYYKTSDIAETAFTAYTVVWNAALRSARISPTTSWTDNTVYRVEFTTAIKSAAGSQLDGNGNNIAEAPEFDNAHVQFTLGAPVGIAAYTINSPVIISGMTLDHEGTGGTPATITGPMNSIPVSYGYVTITTTFNVNLDEGRIYVDHTTLHSNLTVVVDATGAAVAPKDVSMTAENIIQTAFALDPDTRYRFEIKGGINGVRSSILGTDNLMRGRLLGGEDSPGIAEAADKNVLYVTTAMADGSSTAPPTVTASYSGSRYWTVSYTAPSSGSMDEASIGNIGNYQLQARYTTPDPDETYNVAIKAIDVLSATQVRVYLPDSFYPAEGNNAPYVYMRIIINRNVISSTGLKLDGNIDGVGGTYLDDYRSSETYLISR